MLNSVSLGFCMCGPPSSSPSYTVGFGGLLIFIFASTPDIILRYYHAYVFCPQSNRYKPLTSQIQPLLSSTLRNSLMCQHLDMLHLRSSNANVLLWAFSFQFSPSLIHVHKLQQLLQHPNTPSISPSLHRYKMILPLPPYLPRTSSRTSLS